MQSGVSDLTALQQRDALRSGELGASELIGHYLARIEELNPLLGSFLTVTAEQALDAAALADVRHASGKVLPRLHGMAVAWKDLTEVAGVITTYGSAAVPHVPAEASHTLVDRLRGAGAVSLGKTQVPEFGLTCYSENRVGPPARNPFDPSRTPGGSSGGSAAAVAAGMLPFAPGSDGGGSIRIPAAATGLVGLKPGRGTIPPGSPETDLDGLIVAGPMARNAVDAALLMDAMALSPGQLHLDAALRAEPASGRPLRIGVSTASPFAPHFPIVLSPEAEAALAVGISALTGLGHHVDEADLRYDNRYHSAFQVIWTAGLAKAPVPADGEDLLMPMTRAFRHRAVRRPAAEYASALAVMERVREDTVAQFGQYDVVLTPVLAHFPPPLGWFTAVDAEEDYVRQCQFTPYTSMVNVAGLPAITVPVLATGAGMSMSVQLIGRAGSEPGLLALAAQLEAARGPLVAVLPAVRKPVGPQVSRNLPS